MLVNLISLLLLRGLINKFIILLKNGNQVLQFSKWLSSEGFGKSQIYIIESIGFKNERIRKTLAEKLSFSNIRHPVSIAVEVKGKGYVFPSSTGKDDFIFENIFKSKNSVRKRIHQKKPNVFLVPSGPSSPHSCV